MTRFYLDSVTEAPGALEMAAATYGTDRILFGTDYPWLARKPHFDRLAATDPELRDMIFAAGVELLPSDAGATQPAGERP